MQFYAKRDSNTGVSCKFCEVFKNTFFCRTPPMAVANVTFVLRAKNTETKIDDEIKWIFTKISKFQRN